jgi:small subunit ribosomal protein S9
MMPFHTVGQDSATYDVTVVVKGGGVTGQTSSVQLGLARALVKMNIELVAPLRKGGLLTRDPRIKERKKPGLKRARKAPTYTKR